MTAARHLLIRSSDGRIMVIDERTGAAAGTLADLDAERRAIAAERAFVWSRFALWFALGAAAGVIAYRIATW